MPVRASTSQNEHSTNTRTLKSCAVWNKSWRDAKSYITWEAPGSRGTELTYANGGDWCHVVRT